MNDNVEIVPLVYIDDAKDKSKHVKIDLSKKNQNVHVLGIFLGSGNRKLKVDITLNHKAKNTTGRVDLRGIFFDNSQFSNEGLVIINRGAKNTDSFYASKILLFDDAKGESTPSLEIDENELKAGHASTIGRPEDEQLFYLRSRGLSKSEAVTLITNGFFEPIISMFDEKKQGQVRKKIENFFVTKND